VRSPGGSDEGRRATDPREAPRAAERAGPPDRPPDAPPPVSTACSRDSPVAPAAFFHR